MHSANTPGPRTPCSPASTRPRDAEEARRRAHIEAFNEHLDDISRCALDACGLHGLAVSIGSAGLSVSGRESVAALAALAAEIPRTLSAVTALAPTASVEVSGSFSVDDAMAALVAELLRGGVIVRLGHFREYAEGPAWPEALAAAGFGWGPVSAALELRLARANAVLARLAQVMADAAREIDRELAGSAARLERIGAAGAVSGAAGPSREKGARTEKRRRQER